MLEKSLNVPDAIQTDIHFENLPLDKKAEKILKITSKASMIDQGIYNIINIMYNIFF